MKKEIQKAIDELSMINEEQDKFKVIDIKTGKTIERGLPKRIAQKLAAKKKALEEEARG